jgi:hypothetical protein
MRFQAVLDLPDSEGAPRATFAAYMLGVLSAETGDPDGTAKAFVRTREIARRGSPDPEGLGVASFGEEARFHWRRAMALTVNSPLPASDAPAYANEVGAAVSLYLEQAARGSAGGVSSLRRVARAVIGVPGGTAAAIEDATTRRLLVAYALSRFDWAIRAPDHGERINDAEYDKAAVFDAGRLVDLLAAAAASHPPEWLADADRLAALAYRQGRYDIARKFANATTGPMSSWVKAKLDLQAGYMADATRHYAEAAKGFPLQKDGTALDERNKALVSGESGVLALTRGDFVAALRQLDSQGITYYLDAAYIAERVLTISELKSYVDHRQRRDDMITDGRIADVLARRLVRDGRPDEAAPYFSDQTIRQEAKDYGKFLRQARQRQSQVGRAEAWFKAGDLARHAGMAMMGSEGEPDEHFLGGNFIHLLWGSIPPAGRFATPAELARFTSSSIKPERRWHYRYVALDEALKAVDLLPVRTQAFDAVLACAAQWLTFKDDDMVQRLYARYVNEGAIRYGFVCRDPDFEAARRAQSTRLRR